jgi:hypothetical protein
VINTNKNGKRDESGRRDKKKTINKDTTKPRRKPKVNENGYK